MIRSVAIALVLAGIDHGGIGYDKPINYDSINYDNLSYDAPLGSDPSLLSWYDPGYVVPSVANLPDELCVDSSECSMPVFRYHGGDANDTSWSPRGNGQALTADGLAGALYGVQTPLLGDDDLAVNPNASRRYLASSSSVYDLTTEHVVVELVLQAHASGGNVSLFSKRATGVGYEVIMHATGFPIFQLQDSGGNTAAAGDTLVSGAWYHLLFVGKRDGSGQWYANGVASGGATSISSRSGSLSNSLSFHLGSDQASATPYAAPILHAAMWTPATLSTHDQATLAAQRFAMLAGQQLRVAKGSPWPTSTTRASAATLSKCTGGVTTMYSVGASWPRVERLCNGAIAWRSESAITNGFLQSRDLSTSWTLLDEGDVIGGSIVTPFGVTTTKAGIIADSTDGAHGVIQAVTLTATQWSSSVLFHPGEFDFVYASDATLTDADGYFDGVECAACTGECPAAIGTIGSAAVGYAYGLGGGWCLAGISFTGTAASHTLKWQCAAADGDASFAGDGASVSCYITDAQLEVLPFPSSRQPTLTTTVARNADALRYAASDNVDVAQGSIVISVAPFAGDTAARGLLAVSDGTANNRLALAITSTTGTASWTSVVDGSTQFGITGGTSLVGGRHVVAGSWQADDARLYVDTIDEGTPDTSTSTSDLAPTTIYVGASATGDAVLNGHVFGWRIYGTPWRRSP